MTTLSHADFYDPERDTDSSPKVVQIYRAQFPSLYLASDLGELRTSLGERCFLGGETLITYRSAITRIYGMPFRHLMPQEQKVILEILESSSCTPNKHVMYWDGVMVINNHQIGNMMPFPSGTPSINSFRADVLRDPGTGFNEHDRMLCRKALSSETKQGVADVKHYDYFDRFLSEVERYYAKRNDFFPETALQVAINYQRGYFDFFQTYVNFIESNLLQDFAGKDLWAITDFSSYVQIANQIIDRRGARFTA
jgi:hypothetical protein